MVVLCLLYVTLYQLLYIKYNTTGNFIGFFIFDLTKNYESLVPKYWAQLNSIYRLLTHMASQTSPCPLFDLPMQDFDLHFSLVCHLKCVY